MSEQTRDWKKEYYDMFRACAESGTAYEKIIAEKNADLARLQAIEAAARDLIATGVVMIDVGGGRIVSQTKFEKLAAALESK